MNRQRLSEQFDAQHLIYEAIRLLPTDDLKKSDVLDLISKHLAINIELRNEYK